MRVIAGKLSGRNFKSPSGHRTHPMSEKIRGALFNSLGDIKGLTVLDIFSGSGALSIEAVSRGAASVTAIDYDISAAKAIKENIEDLGLENDIEFVKAMAIAWSRRHQKRQFDIVIMDPPFNGIEPKELLNLTKHAKQGGLIVLSLPPTAGFRYATSRQELLSHKTYGDAELFFYRQL